jgi:hypothetical protein
MIKTPKACLGCWCRLDQERRGHCPNLHQSWIPFSLFPHIEYPPYDKNMHWSPRWDPVHIISLTTHSPVIATWCVPASGPWHFLFPLPDWWEEEEARASQLGAGWPLSSGDSQGRMEGWGGHLVTCTLVNSIFKCSSHFRSSLCPEFQLDFCKYFYIINLNLFFMSCNDFFSIVGSLFVLSCYLFLHLFMPLSLHCHSYNHL